ncbi:hypothetical protein CHH73_02350 [Shouchella clausii]|uniref:Uncharacterized protein n=1 Tax=Shouchella clausii TaxID=79880 RepID=A0A268P3V1_SHOCL|nr:hypothetical protein CHH73_02350 [Shouchella clausii]PAE90351.1 hypothetical protein CHH72_05070 [Shouchella clausii]
MNRQETKRLSRSVLVFLRKKNEWAHTKGEVVAMTLTKRKMFFSLLSERTNRKDPLSTKAERANAGNQWLCAKDVRPLKRVDPK